MNNIIDMNKKEVVKRVFYEILFPSDIYCISCKKPILKGLKYSMCESCRIRLVDERPERCGRCGKFISEKSGDYCEFCVLYPPLYSRGSAAVVYRDEARRIVQELKYGGRRYLAKNMADIMLDEVKSGLNYDIIVPVPMYVKKIKKRGFCQTTLIAGFLSERSGKPVVTGTLIRNRDTTPMSGLEPDKRAENIRNAFSVTDAKKLEGKRVLLIDDVLTTGSTANECTSVLLEAGATAVYLAVFASPYKN